MCKFSIVVIIKDDANLLENALISLDRLNFPDDGYEVVVVDDGSANPVSERISFQSKRSVSFHYLPRTKKSSRSRARNYGAQQARGDYLLFIDGDHVVQQDLLVIYDEHINNASSDNIFLGTRFHVDEKMWPKIEYAVKNGKDLASFIVNQFMYGNSPDITQDERLLLQMYFGRRFEEIEGNWHLFWSCNVCIPKRVFDKVGGFDEMFLGWGLEDSELGYRLESRGYKTFLINNPVFHAYKPKTMENYLSSLENLTMFYQKYGDIKITYQLVFAEAAFSTSTRSWLECFAKFNNLIVSKSSAS